MCDCDDVKCLTFGRNGLLPKSSHFRKERLAPKVPHTQFFSKSQGIIGRPVHMHGACMPCMSFASRLDDDASGLALL